MIAARKFAVTILIEIVAFWPLVLHRALSRIVPVVAARTAETVTNALVPLEVTTRFVMAPVHAAVASVHVPAQDCNVILSGEEVVTTCWI